MTYHIASLLLIGMLFLLLQYVFFFERGAEDSSANVSRWSAWSLHGTLQWALQRRLWKSARVIVVVGLGHLDRLMFIDVAEANV